MFSQRVRNTLDVSIPKTVSTIATPKIVIAIEPVLRIVSIPKTVSTIATAGLTKPVLTGYKKRFWKT